MEKNKRGRTEKQQEYRDNLAHKLKDLRGQGDTGMELAETLLDKKQYTIQYLNSLGSNRKVGKEIAKKLINKGKLEWVIKNIGKFKETDHNDIAKMLLYKIDGYDDEINYDDAFIEKGDVTYVVLECSDKQAMMGYFFENLYKFKLLNEEVAGMLISSDDIYVYKLAENLNSFKGGAAHKKIAMTLIGKNSGRSYEIFKQILHEFKGLDEEVAEKLISHEFGNEVMENLNSFEGLDYEKILNKLLEGYKYHNGTGVPRHHHYGYAIMNNLDKFGKLDYKKLLDTLIVDGDSDDRIAVAKNIDKVKGLNHKEIAKKLIEVGEAYRVAVCLEKFEGLDKEIAEMLVMNKAGLAVVKNMEKFEGLDRREIAEKLIKTGQGGVLIKYLNKFEWLVLDRDFAEKLIVNNAGGAVAANLDKFKGLDHKEIAEILIEEGKGWDVAAYLEKFEGLNHKEIADKLIEAGDLRAVAANLDKFEGLDKNIAKKLVEAGEGLEVEKNLDKFEGLDEFDEQMEKTFRKAGIRVSLRKYRKNLGLKIEK